MRRLLRRVGPRAGVSVGLIVIIAVVVIIARLIDDRDGDSPFPRSPEYGPVVIDTMGDIGREMDVRYRETAGGGLAATPTGRRLARERLVQIKRGGQDDGRTG